MGNVYRFANDNKFGLTFCVPLYSQGEFYAALCYDIMITQSAIPFLEASELSFDLQTTPLILQ